MSVSNQRDREHEESPQPRPCRPCRSFSSSPSSLRRLLPRSFSRLETVAAAQATARNWPNLHTIDSTRFQPSQSAKNTVPIRQRAPALNTLPRTAESAKFTQNQLLPFTNAERSSAILRSNRCKPTFWLLLCQLLQHRHWLRPRLQPRLPLWLQSKRQLQVRRFQCITSKRRPARFIQGLTITAVISSDTARGKLSLSSNVLRSA